ncbi:MAG: AAA family ATPase [Dehalobacter sp. 4CP]|uniref:sigma-54-dependent Fis family transcriptional regulator n=1 Tax=Dehalobacter sp. CP TaxID=2594474 RepID=UPI0013CB7499|nr:sigma 54-interacting transcriptional regulator [Dehalobacter sp.]NBJ15923.1 AAA family ATPase [Dehalobacter sp. 4CP]
MNMSNGKKTIKNTKNLYDQDHNWQDILDCWKRCIEQNADPRQMSVIRKEIAESWLRSRDMNVNPYTFHSANLLDSAKFEMIKKTKKLLLDTALPIIHETEKMLHSITPSCITSLADENCILLYTHKDAQLELETNKINIGPGFCFSENVIGTHAVGTCLALQAPVQINGPEHYFYGLKNLIASAAAPIFYDGYLVGLFGITTVVKSSHDKILAPTFFNISCLTARAIQGQLELSRINRRLALKNRFLHTTLSFVSEGCLLTDDQGTIILANDSARRMINLNDDNVDLIIGRNLNTIIDNQSIIQSVIKYPQKAANFVTSIHIETKNKYTCSMNPIINPENGCLEGITVILDPLPNNKAVIKSHSQSDAKFTFQNIISTSTKLKQIISQAQVFAKTPANILILGESGTGKELFAQAIHNESRPTDPFIALNCASLPRNLIESELFGYEKGSFTGALKDGQKGKIELANGGTLFLDEIGDMPLDFQPTLLRVLEDKKVMRIGGNRNIPVDFRVIAATNQDLEKLVKEKKFREDLYFRLCVLPISLPPLRERDGDIEILTRYFLNIFSNKENSIIPKITEEAWELLRNYSWPGNIRELENCLFYAISASQKDCIQLSDFPERIRHRPDSYLSQEANQKKIPFFANTLVNPNSDIYQKSNQLLSISQIEKQAIETTMRCLNNDTKKVSEILGISRTTLYRKLSEYQISITK